MPLKIANSLSAKKEEFKPLKSGEVKVYACGPTVYDEPHIGHLRSAFVFEVIRNYLLFSGYKVTFVRNVTDVDDKILQKVRELNISDLVAGTREVSEKYHSLYLEDLGRLGIKAPTYEPKATEHIQEMLDLTAQLIEKGHAYVSEGDVYFHVKTFPGYGKLSKQKQEEMFENVRHEPNDKKKDALDFALWKKSKPGEASWPSPWGEGRPGWHIECSAMSRKYLGETFDIHGGGRDLVFPHHENEIAQSECASGKTLANYWIHHGLITINAQKMSKSLKNFVTLKSVTDFNPAKIEDLKMLFLSTHYSAPLDYSQEHFEMAANARQRFVYFFDEVSQLEGIIAKESSWLSKAKDSFKTAMDDDFNTPEALKVMHELVSSARKSNDAGMMVAASYLLKSWGDLFGLFVHMKSGAALSPEEIGKISAKVMARNQFKQNKDFKNADAIRDELLSQGIALADLAGGKTIWRQI